MTEPRPLPAPTDLKALIATVFWSKVTDIGGGKCYLQTNLDDISDEIASALAPPAPTAEQNCWIVTDYDGGGIRGVFQSQRDAEAEIAAICADHEDLTRKDFIIGTYRVRPAAPPAPTAEPVNWKASYHQACDDADAYKADAEKRLVKMEQNWRSCQHEIAYLRERLKDTRAALPERVSEGKGSLADWIVREARAISGPRTHLQDVEALIQFGIRVAQYVTRPAVEPREEPTHE